VVNPSFDKETQEAVKALIAGPYRIRGEFLQESRIWYWRYAWCDVRKQSANKYTLGKSAQGLSNYLKN
jgi:hypothetical protein